MAPRALKYSLNYFLSLQGPQNTADHIPTSSNTHTSAPYCLNTQNSFPPEGLCTHRFSPLESSSPRSTLGLLLIIWISSVSALEAFFDHPVFSFFQAPTLIPPALITALLLPDTSVFHTRMTTGAFSILLGLYHQDPKSAWHMTGAQEMFTDMLTMFVLLLYLFLCKHW